MRLGFVALMFVETGLAAAPACAQTYDTFGEGHASCGAWTADRKDNLAAQEQQWVLGYISALDFASMVESKDTVSVNTDADGIFGWIDNYCQANPTKDIEYAAQGFWASSGTVVKSDK